MKNLHPDKRNSVSKGMDLRFNNPLDESSYYDPRLLILKAKGIYLWAEDVKEPYIDLLMGYSSTNFGHGQDHILKLVHHATAQFDNVTSFNSKDKFELSKKLIELLPYQKNQIVYFPVGGTKAIDAAIKLAFAYTKKNKILTFKGAFHGYSFGGMSVTDSHFAEKKQFGIRSNPIVFDYPNMRKSTAKVDSIRILGEIEEYLKAHADIAAIIFEPIQGAAGFIIPPDNFLKKLVALASKYKILSICDEIQTALFRTGSFYYINQVGINPDIVLIGKSLAGGYYPLSAVIADRKIFESVKVDKPGFDSTFANNLMALNIANNLLDYLDKIKIQKRVLEIGTRFISELRKISNFEFIKDLDGVGMAFSFRVQSKNNTIDSNFKLAKNIRRIAFENHIILQTAGVNGDYIKLSPSLFLSIQEMKIIIKKLKKIFLEVNNAI